MILVTVSRSFAGAFLANAVPHGAAALKGREFPSPFATPPGVGLSSPRENAAWSGANLVAGTALLLTVRRREGSPLPTLLGAALMGGFLTWWFQPERRAARLAAARSQSQPPTGA
jgi:hypothetical protein